MTKQQTLSTAPCALAMMSLQYLVQATSTCDYETHSASSVIMEAITTGGGNDQIARPWDLERVAAK